MSMEGPDLPFMPIHLGYAMIFDEGAPEIVRKATWIERPRRYRRLILSRNAGATIAIVPDYLIRADTGIDLGGGFGIITRRLPPV